MAGGVALLVALVLALLFSRSVTRPLSQLAGAAEDIAAGNYSRRVGIRGPDEIGLLGALFDRMAEGVENARRVQRDFLANVSHELKTPLTSISGYAETLLGDAPDADTTRRFLLTILSNARRMQRLVDDLLDLSRIEGGVLDVRPLPLEVEPILEQALEAERAAALDAGVDLRKEAPPGLPRVVADRERIHLVLVNLVSNAIRHTPKGGTVRLIALEGPDGYVTLRVSDSGQGIPREFQPRIFEKFFRLPGAETGGAGLGLFIARETVRAHKGEIGVDSTPGAGTSIWLTLPAVESGEQHLSGLA
jgi:signal transduction histidine kinase